MFKINWTSKTIRTNQDAEDMRQLFLNTTHVAGAFDTEDTGLRHMSDAIFLYQFGWYTPDLQGYTFVVDVERQPLLARQIIRVWHALASSLPKYLAHNVKWDLHMLINYGEPYEAPNISDSIMWIRHGCDAVQTKYGGVPLQLKKFGAQYIDASVTNFEHKLSAERTAIAGQYNMLLKRRLGWTKKKIDKFFKDAINDADDLEPREREQYYEWVNHDLPLYLQTLVVGAVKPEQIRYDTLNRANIIEYGHMDIILVLETFHVMSTAVRLRDNLHAIELDEANIYPVLAIERVGFLADKEYLLECKARTKQYIRERRKDLCTLAGCEISIGQHALIKTILQERYGLEIESTGNDELELILPDLEREGGNEEAIDFITAVQELRTMEKWYSTYIMRFVIDLKFADRLYTQISLNTTVSGRVSSDFQQFPKKPIKTVTGEELFHPRKLVVVDRVNGYKGIVYLDYSQVELRLQAMYTILVGHPDLNLCRAYMPYKCHTFTGDEEHQTSLPFNYNDKWCLAHAYDWVWYYNEDPDKVWTPLDVHGATTKAAFDIDEDDEDFHDLRYEGKRLNFAKNYGAQRAKVQQMFPHYADAQIDKLNNAYYIAFPGVKEYHAYCYALANRQAFMQNLMGVKYYGVSGHKGINMLVQGTGAYLLKAKKVECYWYLKNRGYKTRIQMEIHDELSFEWHEEDPPQIFFELQKILQSWDDTLVPIVSDMELTTTCWAEKKETPTMEKFLEVAKGV